MLHRIFISLLVCLQAVHAYSQDSLRYKAKLLVDPSFGFYMPLTTLLKGDATDPLLQFDDHSHYWQVLSLSYFFHKHWGVTFTYQAGFSKSIAKKEGQFTESMQSQYSKDYYVTPSSDGNNYDPKFMGQIQRGYLGMIYRLESRHFFMYPKLAIGLTSFYANQGRVILKQKNANDVIEIFYLPNKQGYDRFTLAASASMGYKITKRVFINLNVLSSYYKSNITYTQTTIDRDSEQRATDIIKYKKNILSLGLGAGLIIVI